jgi:hypothetical protein
MIFQWPSFLIDLPSLEVWLKFTFGESYISMRGTSTLSIRMSATMNEQQKVAIQSHLDSLTEASETTKRALPSRLRGKLGAIKDLIQFEKAVKNHIASKDISSLTLAEKKMFMGTELTNAEYDTLTVS